MSLSEQEARDIVSGRMQLHQPTAPFRGQPIHAKRKPGPPKGYWDDRARMAPIKVSVPLSRTGLRGALNRIRG